jgi:UDPglucose--hexose-1-phosphate uridylyltransferase
MIFKNAGADAGASLEHAHSQIVLLPRLPTVLRDEIAAGVAHHAATGHCIFCELIENEHKVGGRIMLESERFIVFAAFAGRFPFETWILPKVHASHFEMILDGEIDDLAKLFRQLLRKLAAGLDDPPYNYFIHTGPLTESAMPHYHWHIELLPRITGIAGFEIGAGFAINPVPPEQAAAYMREVPC